MGVDCPTEIEVLLAVLGEMDPSTRESAVAHVEACAQCSVVAAEFRALIGALVAGDGALDAAGGACLEDEEVASFADRLQISVSTVDPAVRPDSEVLAHLARCGRCRQSVASLVRIVQLPLIAGALAELNVPIAGPERFEKEQEERTRAFPLRRIPRLRNLVGAAAIAAAAAGILLLQPSQPGAPPPEPHRATDRPFETIPVPVSPVDTVSTVNEFRWSTVAMADLYRLTLFDPDGGVIWETRTESIWVAFPPHVRLEPGQPYFWRVSARVAWDTWESSHLVEFSLMEP